MIDLRLRVRLVRDRVFSESVKLYLFTKDKRGTNAAQPMVIAPVAEFTAPMPAATLEPETCQELMDELWNVGFRPTEGSGSAGQLAAVQRHLEDMRTLVFKT